VAELVRKCIEKLVHIDDGGTRRWKIGNLGLDFDFEEGENKVENCSSDRGEGLLEASNERQ
jgi:hypothetical protein